MIKTNDASVIAFYCCYFQCYHVLTFVSLHWREGYSVNWLFDRLPYPYCSVVNEDAQLTDLKAKGAKRGDCNGLS